MSRQIDISKELSAEDREYMLQRGREAELEQLDNQGQQRPIHTGDVGFEDETKLTTSGEAIQSADGPRPTPGASELSASAGMPGVAGVEEDPQTAGEAEANASTEGLAEVESYEELTNDQLREELRSRGLATTGTKAEMVARLDADDEE